MEHRSTAPIALEFDQQVFMLVGGEGKRAKMLIEKDNLVVFESLWHAGPLAHDLRALGVVAQVFPMMLCGLFWLAKGRNLGLWVLRHDGTITSIDEIQFPQ